MRVNSACLVVAVTLLMLVCKNDILNYLFM
jgi:hypothetical protein